MSGTSKGFGSFVTVLAATCLIVACEAPGAKEKSKASETAKERDGGCNVPTGLAIRNGDEATTKDYPFVGMLYAEDVQQKILSQVRFNRRICSATVVCPNVVLTAAHCFLDKDDPKPETYTFHADLSPGNNPAHRDTAPRGVDVRIMSPDGATGKKDMALLKLDQDLAIKPAKLWTKTLPTPPKAGGPKVEIVGYGATETTTDNDTTSGTKRLGVLRYHGEMTTPDNRLLDGMGMLQALGGLDAPTAKTANACGGDSGGAALVDDGVYGVDAKIMTYKDGEIKDSPICEESNITFIAELPRQITWVRDTMKEFCSGDAKVPEYTGPSADLKADDAPADAAAPAADEANAAAPASTPGCD